jgi:5-methylthioadenosine/S-adenosylhomocysteine deaminase
VAALAPRPCDLLVRAGVVLTQDEARLAIRDGAVAVADGTIAAVGPAREIEPAFAPARTIRLDPGLLLPGLVNAHTHAPMTLLRGLADDLPLLEWLEMHIWPVEARLSPELCRLGARLACAEMIRTGTTCFTDMYFFAEQIGLAAEETGLRASVGEGFFAFPSPFFPTAEACWRTIEALQARFAGHGRVRTLVSPHAVFSTSPEILRESLDLAERLGLSWQIHCAESRAETALCLAKFDKRPVELLDGIGALSSRALLVHCVDLTDQEIERIAASGARVAHNPSSNHKLGSGIAPVERLVAAGASVGLGTDGAASNNQLNLFQEMRQAALGAKAARLDPTVLPARTVLDMATRHGAACAGWPEVGRIEAGRPADLIALDLASPNLVPLHNPVSQAVYAASGQEVRLTVVAGQVLYEDGRFATLDWPVLAREAASAAAWLARRRA